MPSLAQVRIGAAREGYLGFSGVCSATGSQTQLIDDALRDVGVTDRFLTATYVYRPNASAGDLVRSVVARGFTVALGALSPVRSWSTAPAVGESYEVYALVPPVDRPGLAYSWQRAVNDGIARCYHVEDEQLTAAPNQANRFVVPAAVAGKPMVRRVKERRTAADGSFTERDYTTEGRYWTWHEDGPERVVALFPSPSSEATIRMEYQAGYPALANDDDPTDCPQRLAERAALWRLYESLNAASTTKDQYAGEAAYWRGEWQAEYRTQRPNSLLSVGR